MKTVSISASRQYEILIERGLLRRAGELVRSVTNAGTVMLVSDDSVWPLYGETVQKSLAESGFPYAGSYFRTERIPSARKRIWRF